MYSSKLIVVVVLLVASRASAQNPPSILIENDTGVGLTLYVKSEHKRKWNDWYLPKDGDFELQLESPDRFVLVAIDDNKGELRTIPLPLKAIAQRKPGSILALKKVFETKTRLRSYRSHDGKWHRRNRMYSVGKIVYDILPPEDDESGEMEAPAAPDVSFPFSPDDPVLPPPEAPPAPVP